MNTKIVELENKKHARIWQMLFGAIMLFFICIMIAVYLIAKKANPIMLDEKGNPKYSQTQPQSY